MTREEIRRLRMDMGKFLHSYYEKFGEEKYRRFLKKIAPNFTKEYGEVFNETNLRIMEAEYVALNDEDGYGKELKSYNTSGHIIE